MTMGGRSAVTEVAKSAVLSAAVAIEAIPNPFMIAESLWSWRLFRWRTICEDLIYLYWEIGKEEISVSDRSCQNQARRASFKVQRVLQMSVKKNAHNGKRWNRNHRRQWRKTQAAEQQKCSRNGMRGEWEGPFQGMAVLASWYGFLNTQETQLWPSHARW